MLWCISVTKCMGHRTILPTMGCQLYAKQSVEHLHSPTGSGSHRSSHNVPRCQRRGGSGAQPET